MSNVKYMPELPEVETIIQDLRSKILNKRIKNIEILLPRIVKSRNFKRVLKGSKFNDVYRIGKMIVFQIYFPPREPVLNLIGEGTKEGVTGFNPKYMIVHLKMTGQLIYRQGKHIIAGGHSDNHDPNTVPNKWTRVIFTFSDNSKLYFNDLRTFGYIKIVDEYGLEEAGRTYGIEPFSDDFSWENFYRLFKNRKTNIKAFLLNQKNVAGLGNIYVDEVLFASGILPDRRVESLKKDEIKKIYQNIKPILMRAIKMRGTTFNNYVDSDGKKGKMIEKLQVFNRTGKKCRKCGNIIVKMKVAGRGTHFCTSCQK